MKLNRQQRRTEDRTIHKHRHHPKVYRQFDGDMGVYGETICLKCQCHVAYLDKAEWRELEAYNRNRQIQQQVEQTEARVNEYWNQTATTVVVKTDN